MVEPIETNLATNSADIYDTLMELLRSGQLQPGQKLPTERALAEQHGVTRTKIQKAMGQLEEEKLIERKVGSGTFVSSRLISVMESIDAGIEESISTNFVDVTEARLAFEPWTCRNAASRATDSDKQALKEELEKLSATLIWKDYKDRIYLFFRCIYVIAGNAFLLKTFDTIIQNRRLVNYDGMTSESRVSSVVKQGMILSLGRFVSAIENNDEDLAEETSRAFLLQIISNIHI